METYKRGFDPNVDLRTRVPGGIRLLVPALLSAALACDHGVLPDPTAPDVPSPAQDRIDATGDEGDPHFYFLPPVVSQLFPYRGVFEPRAGRDLKAILTVDGAPQPPFVPFIRPRDNLGKEFYELPWPAPADASEARVEVFLADKPLGSLDLRAAETPEGVRAARAAGDGVFKPGRLTQIRMRVEVGAGEGVFPDRPRMSDGRTTGDASLFFLPPVSRDRVRRSAFDPTVLDELAVEVWTIEEEGPGRPGTQRLVKRFEGSSPVPADRVNWNKLYEFYQATWSTQGAKPWVDYRARVLLEGVELGWVDVDVVPLDLRGPNWPYERGFLQRARRTGAYAVLEGKEAFIRFRVEGETEPGEGDPDRIAYLAGQDQLLVLNTASLEVADVIPGPSLPRGLALTPDGRHLYVTNFADGTVSVIDVARRSSVATVPVGKNPHDLAITPDGAFAYVANRNPSPTGAYSVSIIETATNTVVSTVEVGQAPWGIAITPDGAFAYVAVVSRNQVAVIDTDSRSIVDRIPVGNTRNDNGPRDVVISPDGATAYVTKGGFDTGTISAIDTQTNAVVSTLPFETRPGRMTMSPDGSTIYIGASTTPEAVADVLIYDASTKTLTASLRMGSGFIPDIGISPDGSQIYVLYQTTGHFEIRVIDLATRSTVKLRILPPAGRILFPDPAGAGGR